MKKGKRISLDVRTGKITEEMVDIIPSVPVAEPIKIDIRDIGKLIKYAKSKGWIK